MARGTHNHNLVTSINNIIKIKEVSIRSLNYDIMGKISGGGGEITSAIITIEAFFYQCIKVFCKIAMNRIKNAVVGIGERQRPSLEKPEVAIVNFHT